MFPHDARGRRRWRIIISCFIFHHYFIDHIKPEWANFSAYVESDKKLFKTWVNLLADAELIFIKNK